MSISAYQHRTHFIGTLPAPISTAPAYQHISISNARPLQRLPHAPRIDQHCTSISAYQHQQCTSASKATPRSPHTTISACVSAYQHISVRHFQRSPRMSEGHARSHRLMCRPQRPFKAATHALRTHRHISNSFSISAPSPHHHISISVGYQHIGERPKQPRRSGAEAPSGSRVPHISTPAHQHISISAYSP